MGKRKILWLTIGIVSALLMTLTWYGSQWIKSPIPPWLQSQLQQIVADQLGQIEGLELQRLELKTTPLRLWQTSSMQLELEVAHKPSGIHAQIHGQIGYQKDKPHALLADLKLMASKEGAVSVSTPVNATIWLNGDPLEHVRQTDWKKIEVRLEDIRSNFEFLKWKNLSTHFTIAKDKNLALDAVSNFSGLEVQQANGPYLSLAEGTIEAHGTFGELIQFDKITVKTQGLNAKHDEYTCKIEEVSSTSTILKHGLTLTMQSPLIECESSDQTAMGMLTGLRAQLSSPLDLLDLQIPKEFTLTLSSSQFEGLWGDYYVSWPLEKQALNLAYQKTGELQRFDFSDKLRHLKSIVHLKSAITDVEIYGKNWSLADINNWLPLVPDLTFKDGRADFNLRASLGSKNFWNLSLELNQVQGAYQVAQFSLDKLALPLSSTKPTEASLRALQVLVNDTQLVNATAVGLSLDPKGEARLLNSVAVLHSDLQVNNLKATLNPEGTDWNINAELAVPSFRIDEWLAKECILSTPVPPVKVQSRLLQLTIKPERLSLKGGLDFDLFGGKIQVSDIDVYRWLSPRPETQASITWSDLDLSRAGRWTGIGEMQGKVRGHIQEAVLQGSLPTQFEFLLEARPAKKNRQIIFSPTAMKNVVSLLTPEDFTQTLPGIVNWIAFGLPSELMGGYNISYAGARIRGQDSRILFYTLDPEHVIAQGDQRYIINGRRFKVPLQSAIYPVVIDAPAMAGFIRHVKLHLMSLMPDNKETNEQDSPIEETTHEDHCNSFLF